jgi:acetolactate decarboxylase
LPGTVKSTPRLSWLPDADGRGRAGPVFRTRDCHGGHGRLGQVRGADDGSFGPRDSRPPAGGASRDEGGAEEEQGKDHREACIFIMHGIKLSLFQERMDLDIKQVLLLCLVSALLFLGGFYAGWSTPAPSQPVDRDLLYQVSTYTSLSGGGFGGIVPVGELMRHGDLGLGTFDGLDGEMVVADGIAYQVKADGTVSRPDPSLLVPFAAVTSFEPDFTVRGITAGNLSELTAQLDARLPTRDRFWAIRMEGTFPYVKARSPPAQGKPYPILTDALKGQSVFTFRNVTGTVVGFFTPSSATGVDPVGFHLHFISSDHQAGGHILDISTERAQAQLDGTPRLSVVLSATGRP